MDSFTYRPITLCSFAWILAFSVGAAAAPPVKSPWLWTNDERAAARLDPTSRRARVSAHKGAAKDVRPDPAGQNRSGDDSNLIEILDGTTTPEMFFPSELFTQLVSASFIKLPSIYPRVVQQRTSDLFRSPDEWEFFQSATTEYAELLQRESTLEKLRLRASPSERARIDQSIREVRAEQSKAIVVAMRTLRLHFGRQRFDRMLYEVVAPDYSITVGGVEPSETFAVQLEKKVKELVSIEEQSQ